MSNIGKLHYFLGLEIVQSTNGIFASQNNYVREILVYMKDCNPISILMSMTWSLTDIMGEQHNLPVDCG